MSTAADTYEPVTIPILQPPPKRRTPLTVGHVWHVRLPGEMDLTCVLIEERSRKVVVLRQQADLGKPEGLHAVRYKRADVEFVERVP